MAVYRPQHLLLRRGLTLHVNRPGVRTLRYTSMALLATFACGASAYLFLPSAPSATEQLSAQHFTPSTVIANKDVTPDSKILTLRVNPAFVPAHFTRRLTPSSSDEVAKEENARIYSVFVKDSDIQVERPYTPLECADDNGKMHFWVKKYEKSEVGRWLHARKVGDEVELRGPVVTWDRSWRPSDDGWDEVVMVGKLSARSHECVLI